MRDRFCGPAGDLSLHTSDSGQTIILPAGANTSRINGSGSVYSVIPTAPTPAAYCGGIYNWTPPGTDYAATVWFGADFRNLAAAAGYGVILRCSGSASNFQGYAVYFSAGSPDTLYIQSWKVASNVFTYGVQIGTTQNLASQIVAGDTLSASITGTMFTTLTITVYRNGTSIYSAVDTATPSQKIDGPGSIGLLLSSPIGSTGTDMIRQIWAGSITDIVANLSLDPTCSSGPSYFAY